MEITTIISIISGIFGIFGVSAYISERAKYKAQLKNKEDEEQKEIARKVAEKELINTIQGVIKDETKPISDSLANIQKELSLDKAATITSIRSNMKQLRDKYKAQGYAESEDKITWNELYDNYKNLGGNFFVQWVNAWKDEVNNLPDNLQN